MGKTAPLCTACNKNITAKVKPGLSCISCTKDFHFTCAGLKKEDFAKVADAKLHLSWSCKECSKPTSNKRRSTIYATLPLPDDQLNASSPAGSSKTGISKPLAKSSAPISDSEKLRRLEQLLHETVERVNVLEEINKTLTEKIESNSTATVRLQSEVECVESSTNAIERSVVDCNLEIRNLPESALEDPLNATLALGDQIGCSVSEQDFAIVPTRDSKLIRLTFNSKIKRRSFLVAGKQFNRQKRRFHYDNRSHLVHVNEELTTHQKRLYHVTKQFQKKFNFKFAWFDLHGQLWLKKSEGCTPHLISSASILNESNKDLLPELWGPTFQESGVSPGGSQQ